MAGHTCIFVKEIKPLEYMLRMNSFLFQQHGGDITNLSFITDAVQSVLLEMGLSNDLKELTLQEGAEVSVYCIISLFL